MAKAAAPSPRIEAYIDAQPKALQDTLRAAATHLREAFPGATEGIKWNVPCWSGNGNVAALMAHPGHVNLQLFHGARLSDPTGRLEGTGTGMRHAKLRAARDLKDPALKALTRAAWRLDQEAAR